MNWQKNRLVVAILGLAGLVGATVYAVNRRTNPPASTVADALPELPKIKKEDVQELVIASPDKEPVTLKRKGDAWQMVKPVDALADDTVINTAIEKLTELEVTGVAATNTKNHQKLEVDAAQGIHVVAKSNGSSLVDLVIGAYKPGNTMVRLQGKNEVLSVKGSIKWAFNKDVHEWRDRKVVNVEPEHVRSIEFVSEGGTFKFSRDDSDSWVDASGKKPIERFSGDKVQSIVSSIAQLSATNFGATDMKPEAAGLNEPTGTVTVSIGPPAAKNDTDGGVKQAEPSPAAESRSMVLRVGGEAKDDNGFYLQIDDNPTIYVVSKYLGDRLQPAPDAFQEPEKSEEKEEQAAAPAAPPAGNGQIPPDVMQKIQAQLRNQGAQ